MVRANSPLVTTSFTNIHKGPLISNFVVQATNWRWTQYITLIFAFAALLFAIGIPETYPREITRRQCKYRGIPPPCLAPPESGVTLAQMAHVTIASPLNMLVSEPIVAICAFYLALNFAVVFQWFITFPSILTSVYSFTPQEAGLTFSSAIVGVIFAAITVIIVELGLYRQFVIVKGESMPRIEYRLVPAMIGGVLQTVSLFWIGWTMSSTWPWASPVIGIMVYIWGNTLVLVSF